MWAFFSIIATFLLSGVAANSLVQKWQYRNWVNQQRMLKAGIELEELKKLVEKITALADARNYRARKICRSINNISDEGLLKLRDDYDGAVTAWNDSWNLFCVKLTMYADFGRFVVPLENLQTKFVKAGGLLLYALKNSNNPDVSFAKRDLEDVLNSLSGETFGFSRDLLRLVISKEKLAYEERKYVFSRDTLESTSLWKLIKFLFELPELD